MNYEHSCGAILFTIDNTIIKYVLVMQSNGNYGFPKGHMEKDETKKDTAIREIKEETGIDCQLLPKIQRTIQYKIGGNTLKTVTYFAARFEEQSFMPADSNEILAVKLLELDAALSLLKHPELKNILIEVDYMLHNKFENLK